MAHYGPFGANSGSIRPIQRQIACEHTLLPAAPCSASGWPDNLRSRSEALGWPTSHADVRQSRWPESATRWVGL